MERDLLSFCEEEDTPRIIHGAGLPDQSEYEQAPGTRPSTERLFSIVVSGGFRHRLYGCPGLLPQGQGALKVVLGLCIVSLPGIQVGEGVRQEYLEGWINRPVLLFCDNGEQERNGPRVALLFFVQERQTRQGSNDLRMRWAEYLLLDRAGAFVAGLGLAVLALLRVAVGQVE